MMKSSSDEAGRAILSDNDPRWIQHNGRENHREPPEWNPRTDLAAAQAFYCSVSGRAQVFLDLLIDHPGMVLSVEDFAELAGRDVFPSPRALAGVLQGLAKPQQRSNRRYPFYWWRGHPTCYAMKPTVAELFQRARSNLEARELYGARPVDAPSR